MAEPFISYATLKANAIRALGNVIEAVEQSDVSAASTIPSPSKTDVAVLPTNTVVALYMLELRADESNWQAEVTIPDAIAAGDYTITLDITYTYTTTGSETKLEVLEQLQEEINDNSPADTYVVVLTPEGTDDGVLVISNGTAAPDARVPFAVAVTANLSLLTDATTIDFQVFGRIGDGALAKWGLVYEETGRTFNKLDRLDVAGLAALDLRITATDGRVRRSVYPGVAEG